MPYNGSGTFTREYDWTEDAANNIDIDATRMDTEMDGMATGLSTALTKDGQTNPTQNLPMNSKKHTGVANASARTEYAAAGQVQDDALNYVATVGGTADAITLSPSPAITAYAAGQRFTFVAASDNTSAAVTVNVSGVGTKSVKRSGGGALAAGDIASGALYTVVYDGTNFQLYSPVLVSLSANRKTGTAITDNDTLSIAEHSNQYVRFTGAASKVITIPANSGEAFATGTEIEIFNATANSVTITADTGVTVNGVTAGSIALPGYQSCALKKAATDTWDYAGPDADAWA